MKKVITTIIAMIMIVAFAVAVGKAIAYFTNKKERYFITSYIALDKNGNKHYGTKDFSIRYFPSRNDVINIIKKDSTLDAVIITGMIELNETDLKAWNSEE